MVLYTLSLKIQDTVDVQRPCYFVPTGCHKYQFFDG